MQTEKRASRRLSLNADLMIFQTCIYSWVGLLTQGYKSNQAFPKLQTTKNSNLIWKNCEWKEIFEFCLCDA